MKENEKEDDGNGDIKRDWEFNLLLPCEYMN